MAFDPGSNYFGFYDGFCDQVHVNEKLFYDQGFKQLFYLTEGERGPVPRTKHKDHLEKVVFLSVIAHPRYECVCLMER